MRESKFRAWDKEDKRMIVHEQDFIPLKVTNFGVFRLDATIEQNRWVLMNRERFEIMQYTGLNDRNGKKIFELDITEFVYRGKLTTGIIKFHKGAFRIEYEKNLFFFYDAELTVIGNIYEQEALKYE